MSDFLLKAVGADPEFFLRDGKGAPVPAIGKIGGTKAEPRFINDDGFSAVQEDNVMVEFNIAPAKNPDQFAKNLRNVMKYLLEHVTQQGLIVAIQPHMVFDARQLEHPQAKEIGCDPDFSAWTWQPNPRLRADQLGEIRTAGAHVHISYDYRGGKPVNDSNVILVRVLDLALGIPALWADKDDVRRKFYGKAGAFRVKPYGVEYRTLSNFWIKHEMLMRWVFQQVQWSFGKLNDPTFYIDLEDEERIQRAINTADRGLAQELMAKYQVKLPPVRAKE